MAIVCLRGTVYRVTPKVRRTLTEGVGLYDRSSITLRPYCVGWAYQTWFTFKISLRSPEGLAYLVTLSPFEGAPASGDKTN